MLDEICYIIYRQKQFFIVTIPYPPLDLLQPDLIISLAWNFLRPLVRRPRVVKDKEEDKEE